MSSSIYGSKAGGSEREGGLAMHTKMLRYARDISVSSLRRFVALRADTLQELNRKRLRKETFGLCRALEDTVKDETVSRSCLVKAI